MDAFIAIMTLLNTVGVIATFLVALYTLREARDTRREEREAREAERREQAEYHAEERRAREKERQEELEYRAALRQERERELQAEAEARRREHLTRIAQLVAEVRDAGVRVDQREPTYLLDTAQWKLRAALIGFPELEQCRDLAYLRGSSRGDISAEEGARAARLSEAALEEVGRLLQPNYRVEWEGSPGGRHGAKHLL